VDQAATSTRSRSRLLVLFVLMSTFFLAHGVQCAAAELHATSAPTGMSMGPVDHAAQGHTAAALTPVPPHPHDEGTHALLVCFAVLAGAAALLLGARSLWPAVVRSVADHLRSRARLVPRPWPPNAPSVVVLCVSRT